MKVLLMVLTLVGGSLAMPIGEEQDHPRPVVPLVITDYSSVANKNAADDVPAAPVVQQDPAPVVDDASKISEVKPEEKPLVSENLPISNRNDAAGDNKPLVVATVDQPKLDDKPKEEAPVVPSVVEAVEKKPESVNNDPKPAEVQKDVVAEEVKLPVESSVKSDEPKKEVGERVGELPVAADKDEKKSDLPVNSDLKPEATNTQDVVNQKPVEEKAADETKPSDDSATIALNVPKISEVPSETKPVVAVEENKKEENVVAQVDEKILKDEEVKPAEGISPEISTVPSTQKPLEEKPVEKVEVPKAEEEVKPTVGEPVKVQEPIKEEKQEIPAGSRKKRGTDSKKDEKKKPTEVTNKDKDDKKAKAEDIPVKNIETSVKVEQSVAEIEAPKPEVAASEVNPVSVQEPVQDTPSELKPEVQKPEPVKKPDENEAVKDEASVPVATIPEIVPDKADPIAVVQNKEPEKTEEKKLEVPKIEEKVESIAERQGDGIKAVPETLVKEVEKKVEAVPQVEEKSQVVAEEIKDISNPIVEKEEKAPVANPTEVKTDVENKPEQMADVKPSEDKTEAQASKEEEKLPLAPSS